MTKQTKLALSAMRAAARAGFNPYDSHAKQAAMAARLLRLQKA